MTPQYRWRICFKCFRPTRVPLDGGRTACSHCGAALDVPPRPWERTVWPPQPGDRRAILEQQDHKPLQVTPEIAHLFEEGIIPQWKLAEALDLWRALLEQAASVPSEAFFQLTLALASPKTNPDERFQRAVLETALEAASLPRHRQVLAGMLALKAAKIGDTAQARAWLSLCAQDAPDLLADSTWRIAAAYVAAVEAEPQQALALLEPGGRAWPIHDSLDALAIALRADAHEQLGQLGQARSLAQEFCEKSGVGGWMAFQEAARPQQGRPLCPETLKALKEARKAAAVSSAGFLARIVGGLLIVSGLFMGVLVWFIHRETQRRIRSVCASDPAGLACRARKREAWTGMAIPSIIGAGVLVAGVVAILTGKVKQRFVARTVEVQARVLSAERTGYFINNVPEFRLQLECELPDGTRHRATAKALLRPERLLTMSVIAAWIDPNQPDKAIIA